MTIFLTMLHVRDGLSLTAPRIVKRLVFGRFARPIGTGQSFVRKDDISWNFDDRRVIRKVREDFRYVWERIPILASRRRYDLAIVQNIRARPDSYGTGSVIKFSLRQRNSSSHTQGCTMRQDTCRRVPNTAATAYFSRIHCSRSIPCIFFEFRVNIV